jgi:hypothetical protein
MDTENSSESNVSDETSTSKGVADANKKTETETEKEERLSREESQRIIKSRENAKADARKASEKASALEAQLQEALGKLRSFDEERQNADREDATRKGDTERLRKSFDEERASWAEKEKRVLAEAKAEREEAERIRKDAEMSILRGQAFAELSEVTIDPDVAFRLIQDRLELIDEGGRKVVRFTDSSQDFKKTVESDFEKAGKSYLLKSQRKQGSGAEQTTSGTSSMAKATVIPADLQSRPKAEQVKWMQANPELAKQAMKMALGNN